MFLAHSFRLRAPWQCECMLDGATRWSRVFHRPTGLEHDDALWLVCSGLPNGAHVTLNGQQLTPNNLQSVIRNPKSPSDPQPHSYEVTTLLAETNRIEILIPSASPPPTAHRPLPTSFPYDIRLGVVGHS